MQKPVDFPQVQFLSKVLDMLVEVQRLVRWQRIVWSEEFLGAFSSIFCTPLVDVSARGRGPWGKCVDRVSSFDYLQCQYDGLNEITFNYQEKFLTKTDFEKQKQK